MLLPHIRFFLIMCLLIIKFARNYTILYLLLAIPEMEVNTAVFVHSPMHVCTFVDLVHCLAW